MVNDDFVYFEGMTSISAVIHTIESGLSNRTIRKVFYDASRVDKKASTIRFLESKAVSLGFELIKVNSEAIDLVSSSNTHGGFIAECTHRTIHDLKSVSSSLPKTGFFVMLEGIEDPYNLGYSIRSVYASGADGMIISGRNWLQSSGAICRSSAGASELLPIYESDPLDAINLFKDRNYSILCSGIRDSVSLFDEPLELPILLIFGGEKRGLSRKVLDKTDKIVRIDYGRPFNGSLPTSSAVAIMSFEIMKKNHRFNKQS